MAGHRPQRYKGRKRPSRWHRGEEARRRWADVELPDVESGADPTDGAPGPVRRVGNQNRGEAV
jgi:hypothetical protein